MGGSNLSCENFLGKTIFGLLKLGDHTGDYAAIGLKQNFIYL